jgi:hypothetical protein
MSTASRILDLTPAFGYRVRLGVGAAVADAARGARPSTGEGQIFVSYRRDDTLHVAGRMGDRLS